MKLVLRPKKNIDSKFENRYSSDIYPPKSSALQKPSNISLKFSAITSSHLSLFSLSGRSNGLTVLFIYGSLSLLLYLLTNVVNIASK